VRDLYRCNFTHAAGGLALASWPLSTVHTPASRLASHIRLHTPHRRSRTPARGARYAHRRPGAGPSLVVTRKSCPLALRVSTNGVVNGTKTVPYQRNANGPAHRVTHEIHKQEAHHRASIKNACCGASASPSEESVGSSCGRPCTACICAS
jgi:hypothetical protein